METTNGFVMARPMMSFSDSAKTVLNKYAVFKGRARRSEYWWWCLFSILVVAVSIGLDNLFGWDFEIMGESIGYGPLYALTGLALFIPGLAVCIRRLHDIGYSGWYYLFAFIPLIGTLLLLWWFTRDSQRIDNEYGPSQKYYTPDNKVAPAEPSI